MGAENSREQYRERGREQAIKDEANRVLERQKRLYEQQCKALERALETQQSAYLELKKKEEIQNEVQRLLKERQDEDKKVAGQQTPTLLTPSAPPAYLPPPLLPSFQTQGLVQQACPTFQFSNLQVNPHNPAPHGQPILQFQTPTQQYMPAAPKPLLPTPKAGSSNFYPQIPQAAPSKFQNYQSNPLPGISKSQTQPLASPSGQFQYKNLSANQARALSPSPTNASPTNLSTQNLARRDLSPHKTRQRRESPGWDSRESSKTSYTATTQGGKRSTSRPRRYPKNNKMEDDGDVTCCTCDNSFGLYIYQCAQGHSSCKDCKLQGFTCGQCSGLIKDLRNFPLEAYVAEIVRPCPNASEGCNREHKLKEMEEHLKSCPFNEVLCPLSNYYNECFWKGKISEIRLHFTHKHPGHYKEGVGKEFTIKDISNSIGTHSINLVTIGPYNFLVHSKITAEYIYFAVQLLSTQSIALKWIYQFDLYNKSKPGQKFEYTDVCHSAHINIEQLFENSRCAVIPIGYAETFRNKEGTFNYKFFITKENNKKGFEKRRGKNAWKGNTKDK